MERKIINKRWHSRGCCLEGTGQEYFLVERIFWGNYAGNECKRARSDRWIEMRCNDPDCKFRAVIKEEVLSDIVKN